MGWMGCDGKFSNMLRNDWIYYVIYMFTVSRDGKFSNDPKVERKKGSSLLALRLSYLSSIP